MQGTYHFFVVVVCHWWGVVTVKKPRNWMLELVSEKLIHRFIACGKELEIYTRGLEFEL